MIRLARRLADLPARRGAVGLAGQERLDGREQLGRTSSFESESVWPRSSAAKE